MHNKRRLTIFLFITTIGFLGFKLNIQSTQLGQYRGEGYNFFNPLGEWSIERQYLVPNIPNQLRQAYAAQGVNLNTVVFDNAVIKIWGPTLDVAPADRIYNVVFHPDVQRWRNSNNDFNTNLLVGLFDPKGVAAVGAEGIPFNTFGQIHISKHDQIYYSPNNGRFQIEAGRKIVAFWTAALSEDKSKTVIQFNIIIDDQAWSELVWQYMDLENKGMEQAAQTLLNDLVQQINLPADRQTFDEGMVFINRLEGEQEVPAPMPAPEQQQEEDDEMAEAMRESLRAAEQEKMQREEQLRQQTERERRTREEAMRAHREAEILQAAQEKLQREELARQQREREERLGQQAAAELARQQAEQRAREETERARREAEIQRAAQERLQQEQVRQAAAQTEQQRMQQEAADRELARQLQEQAQQQNQPQPAPAPAIIPIRSRAEGIAQERAKRKAAMDAIFGPQ
jgi:hypothetical protein